MKSDQTKIAIKLCRIGLDQNSRLKSRLQFKTMMKIYQVEESCIVIIADIGKEHEEHQHHQYMQIQKVRFEWIKSHI